MEKFEILENARKTLKNEFVGLDNIIDEVIKAISPWYLTPDIISRPLVVSLFGMTGTGKTSLVKRLVELLKLTNDSMFFDCGEYREEKSIVEDIKYTFNGDDIVTAIKKQLVFVFDEFQYAKTLNESGEEEIKPSLRPIWEILDSGVLNMSTELSWEYRQLIKYFRNFIPFAKANRSIHVNKGFVDKEEDVKFVLECAGSCFCDREVPGLDFLDTDDEEGKSDNKYYSFRPLALLGRDLISALTSSLNSSEQGLGSRVVREYFDKTFNNLGEFADWLETYKDQAISQKYLDCSKALVFILGNLDEAYKLNDMSPDMEADLFKDVADHITISDIKNALRCRFRPEQISRIGNNIILYPTLSKDSFKKIIKKEVDSIKCKFQEEVCKIDIQISDRFYDLLYSEGVYPTQGVRPIFTTIGTIFTPLLSKVAIHKGNQVTFDTDGNNFRQDNIDVTLTYDNGDSETVNLPLVLGKLRNPENRKKRYIAAVHEAGHAILYSYLTGNLPQSIIAVSTDGGGFCTTYDNEMDHEIQSKRDIDNDVKTSLAGWVAEHIIFPDDLCLLGSSSDIQHAWDVFSNAVYSCGYFQPIAYSDKQVERSAPGIPNGLSDKISVGTTGELSEEIANKMYQFKTEVEHIIKNNLNLLKETAKCLGSEGSIGSEKFKKLIETFGGTLNLDRLNEVKNREDYLSYIK